MPDAAWRAPSNHFKGTFLAVLDETNRFSRVASRAQLAMPMLIVTPLLSACVRIRNPPTHTLAQRQGVISVDAVSDDHELLSAKTVRGLVGCEAIKQSVTACAAKVSLRAASVRTARGM
jgi:hypothetical protein